MNAIMEVIKKRISIRAYTDQPLDKETIDSLLEAARLAPTARNLQQLEYRVITNKAISKKMSDSVLAGLKKEMSATPSVPGAASLPVRPDYFYNAPLVIVITAPRDNPWSDSDAALAAMNIMLYATSINLGTCFIGMARLIHHDPEMLKELHIEDHRRIAACVVCGHPAEQPMPKEKKISVEFIA
jgi:nitroreductase